ncbi:zonular occludens toxin domain-containing protein [Sulfurimonas sp.]
MLSYYLGLPGSGKTYKAVETIYNNFSDSDNAIRDKKVTFKNCYTNINEFKFDKIDNVYRLDFDETYSLISELHDHYKAKEDDEFLLEFLEKHNLKDTLFVIDEAHNFFDVENKVLVWWLSYHRHLHHEIILITQNLSLIHSKYKPFSEFFYEAKPRSLVLFKSYFKYNVYCSSRLSQKSLSGSIKVKSNPEVFALYKSGDSIDSSNVILKFLMISAFLLVFLVVAFYIYFQTLQKDEKDIKRDIKVPKATTTKPNQTKINTVQKEILSDDDFTTNTYFTLECSKKKCINDVLSIPPQLLKIFIKNKSVLVLYAERVNSNLSIYHLDSKTDFYNYLKPKKGSDNAEFKDMADSSLNLGFGTSK